MKNASDIITSIQYKPQYKKLLGYKCIDKLKDSLLLSIQNYVKNVYIKNKILYFKMSATLNKHDLNNAIETLKMILNSPMILKSQKFIECQDIEIDDVIFFVDHKPKTNYKLYGGSSNKIVYEERASGNIKIEIEDEKLRELAKSIQTIIKEANDS